LQRFDRTGLGIGLALVESAMARRTSLPFALGLAALCGCAASGGTSEDSCADLAVLAADCLEGADDADCAALADEASDLAAQLEACAAEVVPDDELADAPYAQEMLTGMIAAPIAEVWDFYTTMHPGKLLGSIRVDEYSCPPPLQNESVASDLDFPGFAAGMTFHTTLEQVIEVPLDIAITAVDPRAHAVAFAHLENAPARGTQEIRFQESLGPNGPITLVLHRARYRGRNPFYHSLYPLTHQQVFGPYHGGAKTFVERHHLLATACAAPDPLTVLGKRAWFGVLNSALDDHGHALSLPEVADALCAIDAIPSGRLRPYPVTKDDFVDLVAKVAAAQKSGTPLDLEEPSIGACTGE